MSTPGSARSSGHWRPALAPQRKLWLLHELDSRRADNFVPLALRYEGTMPLHLLRQALGEVVRRHVVLRWQFRTVRDGLEFVEHRWSPPAIHVAEVSCAHGDQRTWTRIVRCFVTRPFAIDEYPLFRFLHVRLGARDGLIVGVFHHTIADGWSMSVLGAELQALWDRMRRGQPSALPKLDVQYADLWAPDRTAGRASSERSLAYWKDALRDLDEAGGWPWPRRKARDTRNRVRRHSDRLAPHEAAAIVNRAGKLRASSFLFFVAVFAALRARLSGRTQAIIGTDAAGRTEQSAERLIGFFINVLPLRVETDPAAHFVDHLEGIRRQFLAAYEHQHANYEEIVRAAMPPRAAGRNPLFNVKLMMHNFLDHRLRLPGVTLTGVPVALHGSSEDLKLFIRPVGGSFALDWEARADCFSDAELAGLARLFRESVGQVLASPSVAVRDLVLHAPQLSDATSAASSTGGERREAGLEDIGSSAAGPLAQESGVRALGLRGHESDERVLVQAPGVELTAAGLAREVDRLARALRAKGVGPDVLVGLYLPPSVDSILTAAATLAAGGGFVSVDPRDTPEVAAKSFGAARPAILVIGGATPDFALGSEVQVVRMQDLASPAESDRAASVPAARPDDLALVQVEVADDGEVSAYRFTHASLASQLAAWAATWKEEPGRYVGHPEPDDVLALIADLSVCLEQQRTLVAGGVSPRQAGYCYVRLHASQLSPPFNEGAVPANVVLEGRVTPATCAAARGAHLGAGVHVFTRVPGVPLAAGHVEWSEAGDDLCRMPAGGPVGQTRLHLLDAGLQPAPVTGFGEIYASGDIAAEARGNPERIAGQLVPSPFVVGERLVRTGLVGVRLADGNIMVIGERRRLSAGPGQTCDASRIECALLEHPAVVDALVVRTGAPRGKQGALATADAPRIVALVTAAGEGLRENELWTMLSGKLTRSSMPDAVHVVAALPVDRRGRLIPWQLDIVSRERASAPEARTVLHAELAAIWRELLGIDRELAADENFFDLGGDSLLATRLAFRIEEQFGVEFAVGDVFANRTLALLSARLAASATPTMKLEPVDRSGLLPVASAQNRLLFLHSLSPSDSAYNCPVAVELRGRVSLPLVVQGFGEIARRQEILRTVFSTVAGEFWQRVLRDARVSPTHVDLTAIERTIGEKVRARLRRADLRRPFVLGDAPAFRVIAVDAGDGVWELAMTVHHLVSDAWSQRILVRELSALAARYQAGRPSDLAPLSFQYGDYASWQSKRLQGGHLARLMDGWSKLAENANMDPVRIPPTAGSQPPTAKVGYRRFNVPSALQKKLEAVCRSRGVTLYMLALAAFQQLLHRASEADSATIIASAANRYPREMENVVGFFANTFPVMSTWRTGDTIFTLLERTRDYLQEALRLQELPFDRIVEALRRTRPDVDPSRLNISFVMTPSLGDGLAVPGGEVRSIVVDDDQAKFDLEMQLNAGSDGLDGTLEYATTFLSDEAADALVAQYLAILDGVVAPATVKGPSRPVTGLRRAVPLAARPRPAAPAPRKDWWQEDAFPAVFSASPGSAHEWEAWYAERRAEFAAALKARGAIVFRNTPVSNVNEFRRLTQALAPNLMTYTERSSPRTDLADQVYTSTEYPADETIFLHNECSYSRTFPQALFFYCDRAATEGGETILCDSRRVHERLSAGLKRRFEAGVTYARHYSGYLDLTWETAFQTSDVMEVERYCKTAGITWNWTGTGGLKTRQIGQASLRHPETGEHVWFNQAHMFHLSALKDEYRDALLGIFDEADVPRHAYLADGSPIDPADLEEIRSAYRALLCDVRLERGDVLWLDNILCAHGRRPFTGDRRLAVIMTEPMHVPEQQTAQEWHAPQS